MPNDKTLTQPQAAALLGVTTRRIRQRSQEDNPPPQDKDGRYPCDAFGKWLIEDFRRNIGVGNNGKAYDYNAERARMTHHQANSAALDEQAKQRILIPADQVRLAWSDMVASARAKLLALPSRLASTCAGKPAEEVDRGAKIIIYEALTELAQPGENAPCAE